MKILGHVKDNYYPCEGIDYERITVRCIVKDKDNKVAVLYINCDDELFGFRDHYELPGGGVENNEDLITALHREIKEEIGVTIKEIKEIGIVKVDYHPFRRTDVAYYYSALVDCFGENNLTTDEQKLVKSIEWIEENKLLQIFQNEVNCKVANIIYKREIIVLKEDLKLGGV